MEEIDYSRPFPVRIVDDVRKPEECGQLGNLSGRYGVCLGLYAWDSEPPRKAQDWEDGNPYIMVHEEGVADAIWGVQCWWTKDCDDIPINLQKEALEEYLKNVRKNAGLASLDDFDFSSN
jgi:hypothetical protein